MNACCADMYSFMQVILQLDYAQLETSSVTRRHEMWLSLLC